VEKIIYEKDFNYWRWLSDEEWMMDPDNVRFTYDLGRGVFRKQELAVGVQSKNLGKMHAGSSNKTQFLDSSVNSAF